MQEKNNFKLIFNSKIFHIPFQSCCNINPSIYNSLFSKGLYEVKSDINEKNFQSFLNYLINKEIPLFEKDNINEYHQISEEFDIMKDIVHIFEKCASNSTISSLLSKNNKLRDRKNQQKRILKQKEQNYGQIIHLLFDNNEISNQSNFLQVKHKLFKACSEENIKLVDLLIRKKVRYNGLLYALNKKDGTAGVFRNLTVKKEVTIPRSIQYESKEFIVTIIYKNSFKNSNEIESIEFPDDSKLDEIEKYAFMNSSLKKISIPASVTKFNDKWCGRLLKLQIELDPRNLNYSNFENRFILGKVDSKSDEYNILVYSLEDAEIIKIPSFIKRIAPFAFYASSFLKIIDFDENSQLQSIGKFAFANSSIENISIPKNVAQIETSAFAECNINFIDFDDESKLREISSELFYDSTLISITIPNRVTRICDDAFFFCGQLKDLIINEDSELQVIGNSAFYGTKLQSISLSSSVELKKGWNNGLSEIKDIKIFKKKNENIKIYKEFILGKSDIYQDIYDVILFVNPRIDKVTIPSFIKCIKSHAFSNSKKLKFIEFENGSQLEKIEGSSFDDSFIEKVVIPPHVTKIEENCFSFSNKLKRVEFSNNSEIKSICNYAFSHSNIEFLSLPSSIINLNDSLFKTPKLNNVNIIPCSEKNIMSLNDQLIIGKSDIKSDVFDVLLFAKRNIKEIQIPSYIKKIGPSAFNECKQLEYVTFSDDSQLISIETDAFSNTSIQTITIPKNVIKIGKHAFISCYDLKKVEILNDSNLKKISKNSFSYTSIEYFYIPDHLTKIGMYAFEGCENLKRIEFSKKSNLRLIEREAFSDSSIESILIPRHIFKIAKKAFNKCKLKRIEFENYSNLQLIDTSAFLWSDIECIEIPSSVKFIGENAFKQCNNLQIIEFTENMELDPLIIENLDSISQNCIVMIPVKIIKYL